VTTVLFELAGQQPVLALKNPAEQPDSGVFRAIFLMLAEQYNLGAGQTRVASRLL
jgi:hypothetical protein